MDASGWLQLAALGLALLVGARVLGAYIARVFRASRFARTGSSGRSSGSSTALVRRRPGAASSAGPSTRSRCSPSASSRSSASTCSSACRARCRSTRRTSPGVPPALAFNTAVSFVTNTNWQNYAGESTMSHLTQMVGLAVQNFVSAAVGHRGRGRAHPRPHAGAAARRSATSGSTSTRTVTRILLPLSRRARARARRAGRDPEPRRPRPTRTTRRGRDAGDPRRAGRQPGGDQGARHQRRRVPQRQLGAPVREPDGVHELARDLRAPADPVRARLRLRAARRRTRGRAGPCFAAMVDPAGSAAASAARRQPRVRRQPSGRPALGARRAATSKARRSASARRRPGSSPRRRPAPRPARSTARTTASRRSAAPCRWST